MADQPRCDKCAHFLREDGGCTHCERAAFLAGPVRGVSIRDAETILSEPVEVRDRDRRRVVFRKEKLLWAGTHAKDDHPPRDYARRCHRLLYAIDTVRNGKARSEWHRRGDGARVRRTKWTKHYKAKGDRRAMDSIVFADKNGDIREVFTFWAD